MLQQRLATFVVVTEDMGMEDMVGTVDGGYGYYGKRSAEANAEPGYLRGGYGSYGYGCSRGYYGKREAEAVAEADAEPGYLSRGYGYGGYGYRGYRGYRYGRGYY